MAAPGHRTFENVPTHPDEETQAGIGHATADRWIDEHLGRRVYQALPGDARRTYRAGVRLYLAVLDTGNADDAEEALSDYSVLVLPFARAFEGLVRLVLATHTASPVSRIAGTAPGRERSVAAPRSVGAALQDLHAHLTNATRTDSSPNGEAAHAAVGALLRAWRDVRCSTSTRFAGDEN
jgi:hypothetical protein